MLIHRETLEHAAGWRPTDADAARWQAGADARLGDLALFHQPRIAALGVSEDPTAGALHLLDWDPGDGLPPLPVALVEIRHRMGPVELDAVSLATHPLFVYGAAAAAPGLLEALVRGPGGVSPRRMLYLPHLPVVPEAAAARLGGDAEIVSEDDAPKLHAVAKWGGSFEAYWKAREQGIRTEVPRLRRKLQALGRLEAVGRDTMDEAARAALTSAAALHAARWGGEVNAASDTRAGLALRRYLELGACFESRGALRLRWLEHDGRLIALMMAARFGSTLFLFWAAYDAALSKMGPGSMIMADLVKEGFDTGATLVDFMIGAGTYKRRWTDESPRVTTVLRGGRGLIEAGSFAALAAARRLRRR